MHLHDIANLASKLNHLSFKQIWREANFVVKSFTNLGHSTPISNWNLPLLIQMEKRAKKPHYAFVAFYFASSVAAVLVKKR